MRSTALLLGAALWCAASTASAQSANLAEAKKRMTEAKALYGKGDFEEARLKYVEACSIARTDNCVRSLAVAELAAGRPADAYVHFQEVQRGAGAAKLDPRAARELNELVQEAYGKCGHVEVSAPPGTLLAIDSGAAVAVPRDVIAVEPGGHSFEATRGDRHKRVTQDAPAGKVVRVAFNEEDLAPVVVPPVVVAPVTQQVTYPGTEVESGKKTWPPVGAWVLGGVGLVGIGVGVGFAVAASSQSSMVSDANAAGACRDASSPACKSAQDAKSATDRDHAIEAVAFSVGGAALTGSILWTLLAPRSSTTTALAPDFGPGRAGLHFSSTF